MSSISAQWKILVENWETIETKYNSEYEKYGKRPSFKGDCNMFIRSLNKSVKK
jgi:hypothetical protein